MIGMLEIDNVDIQEPLGRTLAKLNHFAGNLTIHAIELMKRVFGQETLNVKRNSAVYLYQVVDNYGKS